MTSFPVKESLEILTSHYDYASAYHLVENQDVPEDVKRLVYLMKRRRQLAIEELFEKDTQSYFKEKYRFQLVENTRENESLANYIMDLQAKVLTEDIIDFVRAVSPIIYRLFMRLIVESIPDIQFYIVNAKDAQYDTWKFDKLASSSNEILQNFVKIWHDPRVTSRSLEALIELLPLPTTLKKDVQFLRKMEKSVRNPLAHLIKPFDEAILHETTGFSSKAFLEMLIKLAQHVGVTYTETPFYFDQVNQLIGSLLDS